MQLATNGRFAVTVMTDSHIRGTITFSHTQISKC